MDGDNKFDKICFCCLTEDGLLKNMMDEVLLSTKIKIQFVEGYTVCSGIAPDTSTSKNICLNCEEKLKSSYAFRELCRASYHTLKERSHQLIAEMCVDVKHEVATESETDDFVYDIFDEEVKSDPCQFNQVFVQDTGQKILVKRKKKAASKRHSKKRASSPIENDAATESPMKSEQTDDSDDSVRVKRKPKVAKRSKRKEARPKKVKPPPAEDTAVMESTFVCYYCDAVLQSHNDFQKHRTEHMIRNSYPSINRICNVCQEDVKHYVKHILDCHKDYRPNTCHFCTAGKFQNPCDLKNHLSFHLSCEPSHECLACKEKFRNEIMLRTHISQHKNIDDLYMCPYCGMSFDQFLKCQEHFHTLHDQSKKLYPCFHCKRIYMVSRSYNAHDCAKRNDNAEATAASVKCDQCASLFSSSEELICHRSRGCAYDPEFHKCKECGKSYGNRKKLLRHLRTHDPTKRSFVCDICGHGTMSVGQLKLHKFRHVTERPFKCPICAQTFKLEAHMRGHQKVHNDKPYECYQCNRRFRTYHNIRQHMAVHSDSTILRKFSCEVCGKNSVSKSTFRTHMRSHTNEHNSKCSLCPKTFGDKAQLKKHHRKTHEGWFYECKFCLKPYKDAIKFRNHLFVHRGFKPYNCPVCPSGHIEKYLFVKHLRTHNMEYDDKVLGYREAENIKVLVDECLKNVNNKDDHVSTASASGVRIVETAIRQVEQDEQVMVVEPPNAECYETSTAVPQMSDNNVPVNMLLQKHFFPSYGRSDNPYQI